MPKRYFNWKLAIVLALGLVVLGATAYVLRQWQRGRRAEKGLVLGNKAYEEQKWEEAARNLGRYLAVTGDDVPTLLKYADAQLNIRPLKRNNIQQAIAAYRTILRAAKDNSEAAIRLTELYLEMGMHGEAELIARRVLETNQSPQLQRTMAITLANQRKFKEAAEELETIIKEHPEQVSAYEVLGRLTEQRPEDFLQDSQFWFDEAVKNNPSSAEAYIIRGAYYLRHNDRTNALSDLLRAEQEDLSNTATRLRLAELFINANALDNARNHLEAVQSLEPANQLLWQIWARFALRANSKSIMLNVAESGLKELSSQPWDFMPTAVELFILSGELNRADECISELHIKDIAPATTAFLEGLLADKKGQGHEAVKCWYRAMQLTSEPMRIRLALTATLSRLGNKQLAIQQLRTLVSEQPNLLRGRLNLARLLTEVRNWPEATEQARIAMQISPDSLDAALLYVQARIQLLVESQVDKDSLTYKNIEDLLAKLEDATDGTPEVKFLQFQLAIQQENFISAEALLTELKKAQPSQIKVSMAEVELLAMQGETEQAVLMLKDIIKRFPEAIEPVQYLAILLAKQADFEQCEGVIKNTFARIEDPITQRKLCLLLASLYQQWNQQENEYELLNSFAQKLPNDIPIKRRLLACEQITKNPEKAQQLVNNIRTLEGEESWQWRYEQAKIWFAQDNFKDMYPQIVSLLKENLLANPDDQASRTLLASAYERAGELRLAISTYDEALNRSPRDIRIIVPTVAALYRANEYNRADEILRRVASEKLFHPELKKLELQSYLRRGELSSASDILENLLASDPNNRPVCLALSLIKMRQKKFAEADELLSKLKVQEPNSLPIAAAQIELNIQQNKSTEALL
ncbi:MAG: tetratricopeptide repeat protein, partial [Planctomycetota bacterium]